MTDCPRADMRDLLPDLLHDTLDAALRAEVERHVTTCEACAQELALLRSLRETLSAAPAVDVTRIAAAVHLVRNTAPVAERGRGVTTEWRHDWRRIAAAAILLLALGAGGYALTRAGPRGTIAPATQVASRPGQPGPPPPARSAPASAMPPRGAATPATAAASSAAVAAPSTGLMLGAGVSDLPTADIQALLDAVNQMDAIPRVDPAPVLEPAGEDIL